MTKRKIFPAILYFVFTFLIGIFLAVILPASYLLSELPNCLADSLYSGDYLDAIALIGGYYDSEVAFEGSVADGKLVVYKTVTLFSVTKKNSDGEDVEVSNLRKSYVGFLFGVKDSYKTYKETDNQTKLLLTVNGSEVIHTILDSDLNDDEVNDYIAFYESKGVIPLELPFSDYPSIEAMSFIDCDGKEAFRIDFATPLDFSDSFFSDAEDVITAFNAEEADEVLFSKENAFLSLSSSYGKSSYEKAEKLAEKKSTKTIIAYFVIVYLIADLLFTQFTIKFVKFLLFDVFKIKRKETAMKVHNENFGNDYFCAVTLKLEVDEDASFNQDVTVRYGEGTSAIVFDLTKPDGYEKCLRVKAGTYGNLSVDIKEGFTVDELPETLIADGYKKMIIAKIVRRED